MSVMSGEMAFMTGGTKTDPECGDVYRVSPKMSANGDKHGSNGRLSGVVEVSKRSVHTLTRTTHPDKGARTLESAKNDAIGLTKDGYWTDVNQRPVPRSALADEARCRYLGRLPEDETRALGSFWATTLMLGRKNF